MFSWRTTHPVTLKCIAKVPNQKVTRWPKCFSFFFFRRTSSNLRESFTMVFAQNSSIFHWAVHQPIAFIQIWSRARRFEPLTEELWLPLRRHFFFTCTHAQKSLWTLNFELLATKCNYYARLPNSEYCWWAGSVWRKPVIVQPILHRKPVRGDMLLCNRWQTSAQACICC